MGCFHSTPAAEEYQDNKAEFDQKYKVPENVEKALAGATRPAEAVPRNRGVSFAADTRDSPDASNRPSRHSVQQSKKSFVGADLHAIMDDHGMLNPLVSRQLSVMSHYSVRSESGSVMITPEEAEAPFKLIKLIGRGGFGNVYLGDWEGDRVAIKVIAGNTNSEQPEEQEWEARKERMAQMEAILMSAINHPNIVRTMKVTSHSGESMDPELLTVERQLLANAGGGGPEDESVPTFEWHIIMEYCDRGSLSKALASFKLHEPYDNQTVKWDAWASLEILKEVVASLIFLHQNRILHGDLKAANVLLASSTQDRRGYQAKVSDFGLSRVMGANKNHIKTQTFGTVTHMPPELLAKGTLSPSSDVYAMGVLMWEVFTAEKVFKQLSDSEVILAVVTKKARPSWPADTPSKYKFLAEKCWAEMPELRPSLEQVLNELENLQKAMCPQGVDSSRMLLKVYPTRQRQLEQYRAQMAAAAAAGTSPPPAPRPVSSPSHQSPVTRKITAVAARKSAEKGASPLGRKSAYTGNDGSGPVSSGEGELGLAPRTKSYAAPSTSLPGKSPLSQSSRADSFRGPRPVLSNSGAASPAYNTPGSAHGSNSSIRGPSAAASPALPSALRKSHTNLSSANSGLSPSSPHVAAVQREEKKVQRSVSPMQVRFNVD